MSFQLKVKMTHIESPWNTKANNAVVKQGSKGNNIIKLLKPPYEKILKNC